MSFDFDANTILMSILVSSIGLVCFMYGKRQERFPQMIVGVLPAEAAHRFVSVKDVRRRAVQGSLRKRWNERRVIRASERNHRVTVNERGERRFRFVRRAR